MAGGRFTLGFPEGTNHASFGSSPKVLGRKGDRSKVLTGGNVPSPVFRPESIGGKQKQQDTREGVGGAGEGDGKACGNGLCVRP